MLSVVSQQNEAALLQPHYDALIDLWCLVFQLAVIFKTCNDNGGCQVAMFSATMAPDVEQWCKLNLDNPVSLVQAAGVHSVSYRRKILRPHFLTKLN